MIIALLEKDEPSPDEIKSMTKGKLRNKIGLLVKAMDGRVTDHHRFLLKMHLEHLESVSSQINELDEEIYRKRGAIRKGVQTYPDTSCNQ